MKFFPKGAWGYAVLLVLLFCIAAIATKSVIDLMMERFYLSDVAQGFSLAIWALTMGFMFLAGALGLLAISATAEYESRHRITRIVNTMNYLSDGLLALDYQGRIRGANPAARKAYFAVARPLAAKAELVSGHLAVGRRIAVSDIFPSLTAEDTGRLLNRNSPGEIEIEYLHPSGLRMLRLRSQPVEGLILVFVSDITEMHSASIRQQQIAKLQLLGRIAGGVAHDFSNILSAISGHAGLIQRFGNDQRSLADSLEVIVNETHRGVRLSRQLLALSRSSDFDGQASSNLAENVREAEELLRVALSAAWHVEAEAKGDFPVVPLSPVQIVQIVINLGLLAADALKKPGQLAIHLKQPDNLSQDFHRFAAIITILASAEAGDSGQMMPPPLPSATMGMIDTAGVIPSVVRTLIEEAGGRLDEIYASSIKSVYRICLPCASKMSRSNLMPLKSVIKGSLHLGQWKILLAFSDARFEWLEKVLADTGAVVEKKATIDSVLSAIDAERKPDVIIADKRLFGDDANGLLKAVRKICPNSGMVIISRGPEEKLRHERGFIFIESDSEENDWLNAVISSRQPFLP